MFSLFRWSSINNVLLAFGLTTATVSPLMFSAIASAQVNVPTTPTAPKLTPVSNFSDVPSDYWARPFIQALAARNIITGFPNGTYRPNQPVERAEFAAMIQKAFNQKQIRQLDVRGFTDVSPSYWANSAIEEAYETGFMSGYPGNIFLPEQPIPRFQALIALANGLGLTTNGAVTNVLNAYYDDVNSIPNYANDEVVAATKANIVVNYPNIRQLEPLSTLSRAEAAAVIYQALVNIGQVQPLSKNVTAVNYIVGRNTEVGQVTPTIPTMNANNDVVSVAASDNSFSTFVSLLKTAGLAGILQEPSSLTIFAPTNEAFAALPEGTLRWLQQPENKETLIRLLSYHVIPRELTVNELSPGELKTFAQRPVTIQIESVGNRIAVNDARVIQANIQASNGVIHAINDVLIPPNINLSQVLQKE
ncbi:MAG: S-layer homology domain-containing protein [Scytonema sp. PMC 1069.18]|nr:S-layer homology domain-containing protein [Scytonema sp. PMC 1069.18]MEC4885127.1 S-layer homology domain-containing protein [Scytonema sp. PMC 1070.18]